MVRIFISAVYAIGPQMQQSTDKSTGERVLHGVGASARTMAQTRRAPVYAFILTHRPLLQLQDGCARGGRPEGCMATR